MQEKSRFGEQAINKIAEMGTASQAKKADRVQVRTKTELNKLAHDQLDSLAIAIDGMLLPSELEAETLQLDIGRVTLKPVSALRGKIQLVHPSGGTSCVVINQERL